MNFDFSNIRYTCHGISKHTILWGPELPRKMENLLLLDNSFDFLAVIATHNGWSVILSVTNKVRIPRLTGCPAILCVIFLNLTQLF